MGKQRTLFPSKYKIHQKDIEISADHIRVMNDQQIKILIKKIFLYYRERGFPYYKYTEIEKRDFLLQLKKMNVLNLIENDHIKQVMHGLNLAWSYFPHAWNIKCVNFKTPMDAFNDDVLFKKLIKKMVRFGYPISDASIRKILRIGTGVQAVSNFRPTAAMCIYQLYAGNGVVWDMSSGFGGRLIGALASKKVRKYIGTDPSTETFNGLMKIKEEFSDLKTVVKLYKRGSESMRPKPETIDLCFSCYSDDTEILTRNGWKFFKNLQINDEVASLNSNHEMYFVKPTKLQDNCYSGDMIHVKHRSLDLLVTPNHNLYLKGLNASTYKLIRAESVKPKHINMLNSVKWNVEDREWFYLPKIEQNTKHNVIVKDRIKMDTFLEFLGWYISEGSVYLKNVYDIKIYQSKELHKKSIENCLDKMGYKWGQYSNRLYLIRNKQLCVYLSKLGKSYEKYIPQEFMNLSKRQLSILFTSLMNGDGHRGAHRDQYYTTSKKLANQIQEIVIKLGYNSTLAIKDRRNEEHTRNGLKIKNKRVSYVITIRKTKELVLNKDKNIFRVGGYDGRVYCCTVPNNIILIRRNGLPIWCGNSPPYFNTEKYSTEESQSYIKFPTKETWLKDFLMKTIMNCHRGLKVGGHLIINIANVTSFPNVCERFLDEMKKIDDKFSYEKMMYLDLSKLMKNEGDNDFKYEPIYVFKKL
jgi:hypothetical protein